MRALALLLLLAAPAATPGGVSAQGLRAHLPLQERPRPLHERLALADAAAIATVRRVELGRIHFDAADVLLGSPGESFAVKRAPSRPPDLEPGDRALLLLRGARAPWVLVDAPFEIVRLGSPESERLWHRGVAALREAQAPESRRDLYLGWLESGDPALRRAALEALTHPGSALPATFLSRLMQRLPGEGDRADPLILRSILHTAALRGDLDPGPLLARCLEHPREDVRAEALRLSALAARSPLARPALERLASREPNPELRRAAQRALERR